MRPRFLGAGLLAGLVLALPLSAADGKKKPADQPDPADVVDADKLQPGEFTGKLMTLPGTDGLFVVEVEYQHLVLKNPNKPPKPNPQNQNLIRAQQNIARIQTDLANSRNAREYTQRLQHLQQAMDNYQRLVIQAQLKPQDNPYKTVTETKEVEMKLMDKADVRYMNLPTAFDDMGMIKKYTEAEKKALKGDKPNLPGYEGKLEDLKAGQKIRATLVRVPAPKDKDKEAAKEKNADAKKDAEPPKDAKDAPKDKDAGDKPPPEKKLQVKMIVILEDAPDDGDPKTKKKKK